METIDIKEVQNKLIDLRSQKNNINELGDTIINHLYMSLNDYRIKHPKYFKSACIYMFNQRMLYIGGRDYFTWTEQDKIQKDFQKFVRDELKNKIQYLFCKGKIINKQSVKVIWTVRRVEENTTYKFNGKGHLIYHYSGTTYNGFNRVQHTLTQTITIDIDNLEIIDVNDSEERYTLTVTTLNTDFIDKLK